jgi:hypothetical protein
MASATPTSKIKLNRPATPKPVAQAMKLASTAHKALGAVLADSA